MDAEETIPSVKTRVWRWAALFILGCLLGSLWLEPWTEPVAVAWLYPRVASSSQSPIVRFLDLQPLYERDANDATHGRLPAATFQKLLDAVKKLDEKHRPSAIGFDIPLFPEPRSGQEGMVQLPEDRRILLESIIKFSSETHIPVRLGVSDFQLNLPGLQSEYPNLPSYLASTLVYSRGEIAPLWYGTGKKSDSLGVLGIAVATDYLKEGGGKIEPGRSALVAQHHVKAPNGWPTDLQAADWIYVDYSLLQNREELTVHVGAGEESKEGLTPSITFSDKDLERLVHREDKGTLWVIGVTSVPESEDLFVYDERSRWLGEGAPIRRIYEHGAIADTYLNSPLVRVPWLCAILIDALSSLSGLMTVLLLDKRFDSKDQKKKSIRNLQMLLKCWGWIVLFLPFWIEKLLKSISQLARRLFSKKSVSQTGTIAKPKKGDNDGLVRILVVPVMVVLPFVLSLILAHFRFFWFGFVGSATYALIEPVLDGTLEKL